MVPSDKELQWVNVKQTEFIRIWVHSGKIRHTQELFRSIQSYSKPCVTLVYSEPWYINNPEIFGTRSIFRTLGYSELWYIQNSRIFRKLASEACSEPCQTSTMKRFAKIVNGYKYFCSMSLPSSLLHEINIMR